MESDNFSTSGLYWLCKEAENRSSAADSPAPEVSPPKIPDSQVLELPLPELPNLQVQVAGAAPAATGEKRKRGRPPKVKEKVTSAQELYPPKIPESQVHELPPPKLPDLQASVAGAAPAAAGEKRRRGRPPKVEEKTALVLEPYPPKIPDSQVLELPPPKMPDLHVPVVGAAPVATGEKRRRGRPSKGEKAVVSMPMKKRRKMNEKENEDDEDEDEGKDEDEDVCFICFDGGSLVVCDRGDCPKAYHPACIKRDEAFFRAKAKWTCGWHICSRCQKSASRYMCYTCTYSLCKGCIHDADYLCVRGNKGLCSTCYRVVLMIENIDQGNQETVKVDFDDKLSWEYLFKVYWICLKRDLSLTVDEITRAQKPSAAPTKVTRRERSFAGYHLGNNGALTRENPVLLNKAISYDPVKPVCDNINNNTSVTKAWASKKLLDFVAYMRNGDTSVLSQKEVEVLLFDYIKRENLRDPHQRSEIVCDPKLENLFGRRRVRHFEMLSLLEDHYFSKDDPIARLVTGEGKLGRSDNVPVINANDSHKIDGKDEERVDVNAGNEGEDACKKLDNHVDSSGSTNNVPNNQACLKSEFLCGAKSETSVASVSTGSTPSANDREAENSWLYRDPSGKVRGPFGIDQFHKWSSTGVFPSDMRIWRLNTEEHDSVLLGDVIKSPIPLQNNFFPSPPEVRGAPDSTSHHCDEPCSGRANSVGIDTEAHSDGKLDFAKGNGPVNHSSISKLKPVIKSDPLINNDAQIENSSKCRDSDPEPPKVIKSHSNQPHVHSVEQVSTFTEKPHSVHENRSSVGQKLSNVSQKLKSNPNRKKSNPNPKSRNSQGNTESQTKGRHLQENQTNKQCYVGQPSLDGPLRENSSANNSSSHESHPHFPPMANLPDSSEQKFSINLQEFPMPMPKTSNVELPALSKEQRCHENQIDEQHCLVQPSSDGPFCQNRSVNNVNSHESHPHYTSKANLTESSEQKFGINLQDFPMPMPKADTAELPAQTSREQQQHINQINEQRYLGQASSHEPLPQRSSVNNLDSHVSPPQYPSKTNLTHSSERKFSINLQVFPLQMPEFSTGELPAQAIKEQECRKNYINEQRYLGQPSSDGPLRQNSPVNNLNSHESHPHWASTANVPNSSEQRFSINLQDFPMPMPKASTVALPAQTSKEQRWEPPQVSVQNLSIENVLSLTPKSIDQDKQCYFSQSSSDVPPRQNSSVSNLDSHYASMANVTGSSEQKSGINLQDFPMPMPKTSTVELPSQTTKEQQWEPAQISAQNLSIQNMLSLTPKSIDHDEKDNFRNQNKLETQATENKLSLFQNFPRWSSASDLVQGGGMHVSRKATKASMEEWDSGFLSVSSFNPNEIENDPMITQTSKCDKLPPPSPPNPVPNASSWLAMVTEPIEFDTLAEESVSDLLAEVDAMESNSDLASPNLLMDYADDLFHDSKTNFFTSLRGLSSPLDRGKINDFSTSGNMMLPPQSSMKEEPIEARNNTICEPLKKPWKNSNTSSVLEIDPFAFKDDDLSSSGNIMQPPQPTMKEEPIQANNNTIFEPFRKPRKHSNTSSVLEIDAFASKNDLSSSGNLTLPPQSTTREEPIRGHNHSVVEPWKKPRKQSNTSSVLDIDASTSKNDPSNYSGNIMPPPQSTMRGEPIRAHKNPIPEQFKKHKKHNTSSRLEVETKQFDILPNQFESRLNKHSPSPPKKTRDLADIMNAPKKHDNLSSSGSARRESGSKNRSTAGGLTGRESHQKHSGERLTSPRERNPSNGLTSPRDRNVLSGDAGSTKGRLPWSRPGGAGGGGSGGGSGSHSRTIPRGQRVCKFYENGYCRKGAFCDYLHP